MSVAPGVTFASLQALGPAAAPEIARTAEALGYRRSGRPRPPGPRRSPCSPPPAPRPRASASAPACSPSSSARRWSWPWPGPRSRPSTPTTTSSSASASRRRSSPRSGTASPTATGRWPRSASTSPSLRECLAGEAVTSPATSTTAPGSGSACAWASASRRSSSARSTRACSGWPARWPTACCSTTCRPRTCRGRSSRCARAATPPSTPTSTLGVCEREDGIELARRDLFSYAVVDAYARNFERAGFGDEVAEIRERHKAEDREGAVAAVSDASSTPSTSWATPPVCAGRSVEATSTPASRSRSSCRCRGGRTAWRSRKRR